MNYMFAQYQFNSEEYTEYHSSEFEVPDNLYAKVTRAVEELIPLRECDFYHELIELAENAECVKRYCGDYCSDDEESDEEYGEYSLAGVWIDDPGDFPRFKKEFVGKRFPEWAGNDEYTYECGYCDERDVTFRVALLLDEKGTVTDITAVTGGAVSGYDTAESIDSCAPEYDFITESLHEVLEDQGEGGEE